VALASYQESYWSWFSGVVDCALYPVLFYSAAVGLFGAGGTAAALTPRDDDDALQNAWSCVWGSWPCAQGYLAKLAITLLFAAPNFFHVKLLGRGLVVLCVLVLAPLVAMCLVGLPSLEPARWLEGVGERGGDGAGAVDWATLMQLLFFNFNGFDQCSTFAGEVRDPARTCPLTSAFPVFY
jgi:amino acid transporter